MHPVVGLIYVLDDGKLPIRHYFRYFDDIVVGDFISKQVDPCQTISKLYFIDSTLMITIVGNNLIGYAYLYVALISTLFQI